MGRTDDFVGASLEPSLSEAQRTILDFARQDFPTVGHRENAIRETFGYPSHTFFRKLLAASHHPEAADYAPEVVAKVQGQA
jgi:hypothetical protein